MASSNRLRTLLRHPGIWKVGAKESIGLATGWQVLDEVLPGGGWPLGLLTEVVTNHIGCGEVSLFLPALSRLSKAARKVIWVAPSSTPYVPALAACSLDLAQFLAVTTCSSSEALWVGLSNYCLTKPSERSWCG